MLQIADNFVDEGKWSDAILQYYEYIYRYPDGVVVPNIYIKLSSIYKELGQIDLARDYLQKVIDEHPDESVELECRLRLGVLMFKSADYKGSFDYSLEYSEFPFKIILAYSLIGMEEVELADSLLRAVNNEADYRSANLLKLIDALNTLPTVGWIKKYGSIALSAVIPGAGRIIYGEHWNALFTFSGFTGLGLATSVIKSSNPDLYYYPATALILYYSGNIYSTYASFKRYEANLRRDYILTLFDEYPLEELLYLTNPLNDKISLKKTS